MENPLDTSARAVFSKIGFALAAVLIIAAAVNLVFVPSDSELPLGKHTKTIYFNAGMIIFILLCTGCIVCSLTR